VKTATVTRTDLVATQLINATLGFAPSAPVVVRRAGTYTALPDEGTVVVPGQELAAIDGRPVALMTGSAAAWRPMLQGMTDGDDVQQLEQNLVNLGFGAGVTVDRHFSAATAAAVRRWQRALGESATGVVADGDVVFASGAVRVGAPNATVGALAQAGQAPYATTSTAREVTAAIDTSRQDGISAGQAVTVHLSSGQQVPGRVAAIGRVATVVTNPDPSSPPQPPTVPLTVTLDDPTLAGDLDQQPVQIELTTDARRGVLAVPVTALLALAGGGYGVEVVPPSGPHQIVAVTLGLYASGLVELTGDSISVGTVVVVAS
jgi:peptidoglycan hydrolase-like protein with peptidoglycan-binding domain